MALKRRRESGKAIKELTVEDIRERSTNPNYEGPMCPSSPQSIEAYQRLGIDPESLRLLPLEYFVRKHGNQDLGKCEFDHWNKWRQGTFEEILRQRQDIIISSENSKNGENVKAERQANAAVDDIADRERHRLEMARKQCEKEIQMMRNLEEKRKQTILKSEEKMKMMKAREEERERQRFESQKERQIVLKQQIEMKAKVSTSYTGCVLIITTKVN